MKRSTICKWMYALMAILTAVWLCQLGMDYYHYSPIANSAPFRVFVLARLAQWLLFMIYPVATVLYQKKKMKDEEAKPCNASS